MKSLKPSNLALIFLVLAAIGLWNVLQRQTSKTHDAAKRNDQSSPAVPTERVASQATEVATVPQATKPVEPSNAQATEGRRIAMGKRKIQPIDVREAADKAKALEPEKVMALAALTKETPGTQVTFDGVTGAASSVQSTGQFLTTPAAPGMSPQGVVASYIDRHKELFGHSAEVLKSARVTREDVTKHNGMHTLVWNQQVDGVPVFKTILRANVTKTGQLVTVGSHFMHDALMATGVSAEQRAAMLVAPPLSAERAIVLAAASLNDTIAEQAVRNHGDAMGTERQQRFEAPGLSDTSAQLTYMPMNEKTLRLGWDVTMFSLANNEMFRIVVDVQTGQVLYRTSLTNDATDASFRAYADAVTKKPFDSPNPMLPGTSTPSGAQAVEVLRNLVTLQSVDATASPNGWINDGGQETLGNNVDAHTDTDANNVADLPRPNGGALRVFDFACDLTLAPSAYKDAAATHLFYMNNWMHDQLYGLGFTEAAGNFQTNNFGKGGNGNDPVLADAQDGSGTNNANMSTPTDGSSPRMQMYVFTGPTPDRDGDFDDVVLLHEYTHGLSNRLVGGGVGISATATGGMGEGWSDFYGLALLADPASDPNAVYPGGSYATLNFVAGMTTNYYYGIRRYPYSTDMSKNPLTFRDVDPTQASPHTGIPLSPLFGSSNSNPGEVHNVGEVWCMALWECRAQLITKYGPSGNQKMLQLTTDAMKLCPVNPNLLQSRDAIIQADAVDYGGANSKELWAAFAKRGMGVSALSPASSTTSGVTENFDLPDDLTVSPIAPFASTGARLSGPFTPSSTVYTLNNIGPAPLNWTASKTQPWITLSATSGSLAVGGSTTVTLTLDTVQLMAIAAGTYTDTITFTNTTDSAVMSRSVSVTVNPFLVPALSFNLDTDPQWSRQGEWFYGTPTGAAVSYGARDPTAGYTGNKLFGVAINGAYSTTVGSAAYLTTGAINTTGMTGITLRFKRWLGADYSPWAIETIEVSNDGSIWTNVFTNSNSAGTNDAAWTTQTYALGSAADNHSTVFIRWGHRIGATGAFAYCGWNIDDVEILAASSTPTLLANSQSLVTAQNVAVNVTLGGTDSTNATPTLTYVITGAPNNGTLSGTAPNLTYTPNTNTFGWDSFTYTVDNGTLISAPAIVAIQVQPGPPEIAVEQPTSSDLVDGTSTVSYGSALVGAALVKQFVIKNVGSGPMNLGSVTIDGYNAAEFSVGTPSATLLQPGDTALLNVTFRPAFVNGKTAALHIASDDADEASFDIALTGSATTPGGGISLTKDINSLPAGINPNLMTVVGGQAFFAAVTLDGGNELWRTDGTAIGTFMVKDIFAGTGSSNPSSLVNFNGTLFFQANNSTNGAELWKSDGTAAGTVLVKDINSGSLGSSPSNLTVVGSTLYFSANEATNGTELWKSDGTAAGTLLVTNIAAGATSSTPANLVNVNGTLFFTATDAINGIELWKSDGTAIGTVLVKDIVAGSTSSTPTLLTAVGNTLFFSVNDTLNGQELWTSDGTAVGTMLVKDINTGTLSSTPSVLTNFNGTLFFTATTAGEGNELWKSDGTSTGTVLVKDIFTGATSSSPSSLLVVGSTLYFAALDPTAARELWKTDGTNAGTVLVRDIANSSSLSSAPTSLTLVGGSIYFAASDGVTGTELWKSDGTASGTTMVRDINPSASSSFPAALANVGGTLVFSANDGVTGTELWKSDGTSAGTTLLNDGQLGSISTSPTNFRTIGSTLYFQANDGVNGAELWRSDGSVNGTAMVKDIVSGASSSSPAGLTNIGSTLYFAAFDSTNGTELWSSDGTAAGTVLVKNIFSGSSSSSPANLTPVGTKLFFAATDTATTGQELWKSDGTATGTVLVKDINPTASTGSSISNMVNVNGTLFFSAIDGTTGAELWKSDGTTAGTVLVLDINAGSANSSPANMRVIGSTLYFTATTAANGLELWKSDGTAGGTTIVSDIVAGTGTSSPSNLTVVGSTLFFTANVSTSGIELWKSDGTGAGTVIVKDIFAGSASSSPASLVAVGSTLYFAATDSTNGREFWKSDGTAAGTLLVKDLFAGASSSSPFAFTLVNGTIFFTAFDNVIGNELWMSDGTAAGTMPVVDVMPGSTSSAPTNLTAANNLLFYTARGPDVGSSELFIAETGTSADIAIEQPVGNDLPDGSSSVSIGTASVGGLAVSKTFTLKNTGGQMLTLTGISFDGTNADQFIASSSLLGTSIAGGTSITFNVVFNPTSAGAKTAALHIGCNDLDENPFDIALTGTAVLAPEIAVEQPAGTDRSDGGSTILVGDAPLGVGIAKTFTVRNVGSSDLSISSITFDGTHSTEFSASAISSASITPGSSATFDVFFTPAALGGRSAALHINSDDTDESSFDFLITGIGSAPAGPMRLARDINQLGQSPSITNVVVIGGTMYFSANTAEFGNELWKTDGTAAGTVMIKDISTGVSSGNPSNLTVIGTTLYFSAFDSVNGTEFWKSDGTAAGTVLVKDVATGGTSSSPANFCNVAGTLFFTATDSTNGTELWKSDGTTAGTVLVKDIFPGLTNSSPTLLTAVGSTLFFSATDSTTNGAELWKSDGTTAGTALVKDINTTANTSSSLASLTAVGSTLFFNATDATTGAELWKSDGTTAGTVQVLDINAGATSSTPSLLVNAGGTLFFRASTAAAGTELWKSDGTSAGTVLVKDIFSGTSSSSPSSLVVNGTGIYFSANDGINGTELWKSDGSSAGTVMVVDILAGATSSAPSGLSLISGVLYFSAFTTTGGTELWRYDSSTNVASMVKDIFTGTSSGSPAVITSVGGSVIFLANDGVNGSELWKTDGSSAGTGLIKDITPGSNSSNPALLRSMNGSLLFTATDGLNGTELWISDGANTTMLKDINAGLNGSSPSSLLVIEKSATDTQPLTRTLYFSANDPTNGTELWKSDGTSAGTQLLANIAATTSSSSPANLTNVTGQLFFSANDITNGTELWTSDGTAGSTVLVKNIATGSTSSSPTSLTAVGSTLFFLANDVTNGNELWQSDGTSAGTTLVKDITSGSTSTTFGGLAASNGNLYFNANDGAGLGAELWTSNGTAAGTMMVKDINPGAGSSSPANLVSMNGVLYFSATDGVNGTELWRSDGTAAGTFMLRDINPFTGSSSSPANLLVINNTLFFSANDGVNNVELWKTDGSSSGTVLVRDIFPGASNGSPTQFANVNGVLYFSAIGSSAQGAELWRSDGTAGGTVLVADIRPFSTLSSSPSNITAVGNQVFLTATGPDLGAELWVFDTVSTPEIAVFDGIGVAGAERQDNSGSFAFGSLTSPSTQSFTLKNTGSGNLFINDIIVGGNNTSSFLVGSKPDATLPILPGANATFTVTALLNASGTPSAIVSILCNDSNEASFDIPVNANVSDSIAPVISAPATYLVGQPGALSMPLPDVRNIVVYTDNIPTGASITQTPVPGTSAISINQSVSVSFTATDAAGNVSNTVTTLITMGLGQSNNGTLVTSSAGTGIGSDTASGDPTVGITRVVATSDGGYVVAGKYSSAFTLGAGANAVTLTLTGGSDVFLARYRADGTLAWARKGASTSNDWVDSLVVLSDGSIIVAGGCFSGITFGATVVSTASNTTDFYIVRYLADGTISWLDAIGGTGSDYVHNVVELSDGSLAATGVYGTTAAAMNFGNGVTLNNTNSLGNDFWVAKFNAVSGLAQWARTAGSSSSESTTNYVNLIALPGGSAAISSSFISSPLTFTGSAIAVTNSASGISEIFAAKYDNSGNLLWAKGEGGTSSETLNGFVALANGDVALAGTSSSFTSTFGAGEPGQTQFTNLSGSTSSDVVIAALNGNDGTLRWAKHAGSFSSDATSSLVLMGDNTLGLIGTFTAASAQFGIGETAQTTISGGSTLADVFVARLRADNGELIWAKAAGGGLIEAVSAATVLWDGDLGITGSFASASATFGLGEANATTLINAGTATTDMFIAKYSRSDGSLQWAKRGGGAFTDNAQGIALLSNGSAVVVGNFQPPSASFGDGEDNQTVLTNAEATGSNTDMYIARFNAGGVQTPIAPTITSLAATGISSTALTFNSGINSQGLATTVTIEYGATTAYGTSINATPVAAGLITETRSLALSSLDPQSTTHFRVTATNAAGTSVSSDVSISTYSDAEIAVEQPAGTDLVDGAGTINFGTVAVGSNVVKTFTILNVSTTATLTGLTRTIDGTASANYVAAALSTTTLAPGASTTFTVTYTPSVGGQRTAALHIGSNDGDENPFDVALTGDNFFAATINSPSDVPITSNGYSVPTGRTLSLALGFAPSSGTTLTLINNTSASPISGTFFNLAQNGFVTATFGGQTYIFQVRYDGGDGNDLVLGEAFEWTWKKGSNLGNQSGIYGTQGTAAAINTPGGRTSAATWVDAQGNFYLFGGFGYSGSGTQGYLNDLWKYTKATNQWTWLKGSNTTINQLGVYGTLGTASVTNAPGSRSLSSAWVDATGKLWLFGGTGYPATGSSSGHLNDLWNYDPSTNNWTWVNGGTVINSNGSYGTQGTASATNVPCGRFSGARWTDASGNFWLLGGQGLGSTGILTAYLNDLWKYDLTTGQWTWMKGTNTINGLGVFGTKGVAAAANTPGGRSYATSWLDAQGRFWLFGGFGNGSSSFGTLNDLWRFDSSTNQWTWFGGTTNPAVNNGNYGIQGQPTVTTAPGARQYGLGWTDAYGKLWLFGGFGYAATGSTQGDLNDVWCFDTASLLWTYMRGPSTIANNGSYGSIGISSPSNTPGSREQSVSFAGMGPIGDIWLLGGLGYTVTGNTSVYLNDLWTLDLPTLPSTTTLAATGVTAFSASLSSSVNPNNYAMLVRFRYGTSPTLAGATLSTGQTIAIGNTPVTVSETIGGLAASTTYYYQAVGDSFAGSTSGTILSFTTSAAPDISIEQPTNTVLTDGLATIDFGTISTAQTAIKTFTIRNLGSVVLSNLSASIDGTAAADYTFSTLPATLASGGSTSFTVTYAPTAAGTSNAALHLGSDDPDENPFDVALTGNGLLAQTITFNTIPQTACGTVLGLGATASSGLPISYAITAGSSFTSLTGNALSFSGTGSVTIQASQAGNATYAAATPISQTFIVVKGDPMIFISLGIPVSSSYSSTVPLSATTSSNGSVIWSVVSGPGTILGNNLSFTAPGQVVFRASLSADACYNAAFADSSIMAFNNAPVATNGSASGNEDAVSINGSASASDAQGTALTYSNLSLPQHGSLNMSANGSFSYVPEANFNGTDSFNFKANDGYADSNVATITLIVNPVNDAPVAQAGSASGNEDAASITGTLDATDIDVGDVLAYSKASDPAHGTITLNATTGAFSYAPEADFNGTDSFTFKVNDGTTNSNVATVALTINAVNDAPVAQLVNVSGNEDASSITGSLVAADVDAGAVLSYVKLTDPAHGSVTVNASTGVFSYVPAANYNGADSFTFKANDGLLDSNVATVQINVAAMNDAPVASDVAASGNEDAASITGQITATDIDSGDVLTYSKVSSPAHGTATVNANGSFSYTPAVNFNGSDSFTAKANDGSADSNIITVSITVTPVNDAPTVVNGLASGDEDVVSITGNLSGSDIDVGDSLTFSKVSNPAHGSVTVAANGSFTYVPEANFNGSDSFTFRANDGTADSNVGTVTISVGMVNDAPVASATGASGDEDTNIVGNFSATDIDGDTLTFVKVSDPAHGSVSISGDTFTYTPALNYNGDDSFTVKANDGVADSNVVSIAITVAAVNDAPTLSNSAASANEDASSVTGSLSGSDVDGNTLIYAKVSNAAHGQVTVTTSGNWTYIPDANYNGSDSFTVRANDGALDSNIATVTVSLGMVNDAPVASNGSASGNEDAASITGQLSATDIDLIDTLVFSKVSDPSLGSITINASTGAFSYVPNANANGSDSFTFKVSDGTVDSNIATITITIIPVNDVPVVTNGSAATTEGNLVSGALTGSDIDTTDTLTFSRVAVASHGAATVYANGTFGYVPTAGYTGVDSFTFKANDGTADSNIATITIVVTSTLPRWGWMGGANTTNAKGVYGLLGTPSESNAPGARQESANWSDGAGSFYMFGGFGHAEVAGAGNLNDLWKYDANAQTWTWLSGSKSTEQGGIAGTQGEPSTSNTPGARWGAMSWTDRETGKLWLFGGYGRDIANTYGQLSDLWLFDPSDTTWTFVKGVSAANSNGIYGTVGTPDVANFPSARTGAATWTDAAGNLWLMGGSGRGATLGNVGQLNDLWKYEPAANRWTWVGGANVIGTVGSYAGSTPAPGGRMDSVAWMDSSGTAWLFGGYGFATTSNAGYLNDLWKYNASTNRWTFVRGGSTTNIAGNYGITGVKSATSQPGARFGSTAWVDATGQLYMFSGYGLAATGTGFLNDVWSYNPSTNIWTWLNGSNATNGVANYGALGETSSANTPSARRNTTSFADANGDLWVFGGLGNGTNIYFSDLWKLDVPPAPVVQTQDALFDAETLAYTLRASVNPNGLATIARFRYSTEADLSGSIESLAQDLGDGSGAQAMTFDLTALAESTTYYYQASADNASGHGLGQVLSFTTPGPAIIPVASFTSALASVSESDGTATIVVELDHPNAVGFSIPLTVVGSGTNPATPVADFTSPSSSITFVAGQTAAAITIPIINDVQDETNEELTFILGTPSGGVTLGSITTSILTILDNDETPSIITQPQSAFVALNSLATLSVSATGSAPLSYQWKKNGAIIKGATSSSFTFSASTTAYGSYTVEVSNPSGSQSSDAAEISIVTVANTLWTRAPGATATFTVNAYSASPLLYQWRKASPSGSPPVDVADSGTRITGANTKTLNVKLLTTDDSGDYTCFVSKADSTGRSSGIFDLSVVTLKPIVLPIGALPPSVVSGFYTSPPIAVDADPLRSPSGFAAKGLPAGLSINSLGVISGRPTAAVVDKAFTVTASNSAGTSLAASGTITIYPLPTSIAGTYVGTIARQPDVADNLGGRLDVTTTGTGSCTGKLTLTNLAGKVTTTSVTVNLLATIDNSGDTPVIGTTGRIFYGRTGLPPLDLNFTLDVPANTITGTLSDPSTGGIAPIQHGFRNIWSKANPADAYEGYYTAATEIPATRVGDQSIPQGNGYMSTTVASAGTLSIAGRNADGTSYTIATIVGPQGQIPMFNAFSANLGSLVGGATITPGTAPDYLTNDLNGDATWSKGEAPAKSADRAYRLGFEALPLSIIGGKYTSPGPGQVVMGLPPTTLNNARLVFTEGGLLPNTGSPWTGQSPPVVFSIRNLKTTGTTQTITMPTPGSSTNPAKVSFGLLSSPLGQFSGGISIPNPTTSLVRSISYQGTIFRNGTNYKAVGYFLLPRLPTAGQTLSTSPMLSGQVVLEPTAP